MGTPITHYVKLITGDQPDRELRAALLYNEIT